MLSIDLARFEQLKAEGDLPSPRGLALAVMNATWAENVSIAELANIIRADPAFAGRLIKAANGIDRSCRPIASIDAALMALGLPAVRNLALGFSLLSDHRKGGCSSFDYERYWSSSLIHAVAMQMLALRTHVAPPDECYCLGLLCRIGDLALATLHPTEYSEVLKRADAEDDLARASFESKSFAMSHAEISAAMLSGWGMPEIFSQAVLVHEDLRAFAAQDRSRQAVLARSLSLARQIGRVCLAPSDGANSAIAALLDGAIALGLDSEEILGLCDRIVEGWREWGALVGVSTWPVARLSARTASLAAQSPELGILPPPPPRIPASSDLVQVQGLSRQVLVVGADPDERQTLCAALSSAGHEALEAEGAELGAQLAVLSRPQLIIVSCTLPDKSGLAFVRRLRQTRIGRSIYVLGLTDYEDEQEIGEAFEAGVDDFMTRPINLRVLMARLKASQRVLDLRRDVELGREEIRQFAAELTASDRSLQELKLAGSLAGFANRPGFDLRLESEWLACERSGRALSCIVVRLDPDAPASAGTCWDVDKEALDLAATVLKSTLRSRDQIARWGEGEFVALCPGSSLDDASRIAERIRIQLAERVGESGTQALCASLGLACRDEAMNGARELLECAEEMAALAMKSGRNRVCIRSPRTGERGAGDAV